MCPPRNGVLSESECQENPDKEPLLENEAPQRGDGEPEPVISPKFHSKTILDPIPNRRFVYPSFPQLKKILHKQNSIETIGSPVSSISTLILSRASSLEDYGCSPKSSRIFFARNNYFSKSDSQPDNMRRGWIVYVCFLILGLCTLLPWNFFITAESYWMYKFRNTSNLSSLGMSERTHLQNIYTPMQVCLSQFSNFICLFLNVIFGQFVAQRIRLVGSLVVMIAAFSITTVFTKVSTDTWQLEFFVLTMFIIVITSAFGAVFQGGVFGAGGMFPPTFINALLIGQALGGVFASLARIGSLYFGMNPSTSALIFFLIAVVVMILTLLEYLYVSQMRETAEVPFGYFPLKMNKTMPIKGYKFQIPGKEFFTFYSNENSSSHSGRSSPFSALLKDHLSVLKKIWPVGVTVLLSFTISLSVFPVMCARVTSSSKNKVWADLYFQPVVTFLLFNLCDYISRHLAGWIMRPKKGSIMLYVLVPLRIGFIPLFLLCNHDPSSSIPSLFVHDVWYIFFMIIFGLSNGYFASLCMMYAPRMVEEQEAETAGSMMAALIGLGLLLGSLFSFSFAIMY